MRRMLFVLVLAALLAPAQATWKPEYATNPIAVQKWFKDARTTAAAYARLGIALCCEQAERLMTKFVPSKARGGKDVWRYYTDPECVTNGCQTRVIPDDVIHDTGIQPLAGWNAELSAAEQTKVLGFFAQMRAEGVLFIYKGAPSCFWPPETGG